MPILNPQDEAQAILNVLDDPDDYLSQRLLTLHWQSMRAEIDASNQVVSDLKRIGVRS